ncbi:MAG: beta(1,3)galactosyltransferase EpsH [Lactobacillaceae bacterium]|jgi:UDP-N-acetylglucosamine transferase subunit ALG13|nr:beta(1,3)galactosyltransferase EpsH [Lactobacillaceae bacterium]
MIFITLGSQKFQFNRLLADVDTVMDQMQLDVIVQAGASTYQARNFGVTPFMAPREYQQNVLQADVIITHGGAGTIVNALKLGKRVIAMPRLAQYGEHVDDHQIQIIEAFTNQNLILSATNAKELSQALQDIQTHQFATFISNTPNFIDQLKTVIK